MVAYFQPTTLQDAIAILGRQDVTVLAGATDVYPAKTTRAGWGDRWHPDVLDISRIADLRGIEDRGDHWWIGALATWADVINANLPPLFDGLKRAAREVGGVQIQNRGTVVGNCCTASPAGDGIPCLLTLDAEMECVGGTTFRVAMDRFLTGYRKTVVTDCGELVTGIRIPKREGRGHFAKLGARRYLVISIAMVAAVIETTVDGRVSSAAIAVGACSAVAQRLPALEAALIGQRLDPSLVRAEHLAHLTPIDDVRASGVYRRAAALELVRDVVRHYADRRVA
jgi:CO/xanthine dehydrogenase FAD-binding subunit